MSKPVTKTQSAQGPGGSAQPAPATQPAWSKRISEIMLRYGMVIILVGLIVFAQLLYPGFLAPQNISNILSQNAPLGIIAVGMTFVMVGRGFDLSVGAMYAFGATFYASLALGGMSLPLAGALTVVLGLVAGAINGTIVARLNVNPFVATLGTASIFRAFIIMSGLAMSCSHNARSSLERPLR